ncbi:F-box/kelch-repeat protein [Pyrus ussuriensis x Pyrus communis]|uniref:F-box/kelch-repeat protein n=1 Tax=Pyrus ussuriensis x Pyrus communis TaxID=2448454 RepID=A0A5N5H4E0_9ROSA|nr:F-box/kelch-repeat protein [Pyrus ussuriensis x Pyrus communis]
MTYFCNIPDEIGLEILARLLPKSLMRFKCVRKSWYALFNNPHFVAEHLRLYNDQPSTSSTCILFKRSVLSTTEFNNEELNPAIKEFRVLPESCFEDAFSCTLGFGYDPKRKDYMLISIISYGEEILEDDRLIIHPPQAEIYTLSNDNLSTYFEGVFYGLGYEEKKEFLLFYDRLEEEKKQLVISYDASNEVFHDILLPDCFYEFPTHEFSLTVWNESVALFGFYHGEDEEPFEIWVMDEFDDGWTKHLSVVPKLDQEVDIPLILWKRDEVLLVDIDGRLASYNFNTENLTYLPVHGVSRGDFQPVVCVDSMVSVNGDKRVDVFDNKGWWVGTVTEKRGEDEYWVYFETTADHTAYPKSKLMFHEDWIDGMWVNYNKKKRAFCADGKPVECKKRAWVDERVEDYKKVRIDGKLLDCKNKLRVSVVTPV